jgi:penicillin-binding protein 2
MQIAGQDAELPEIRLRSKVFASLVAVGLVALIGRIYLLQVVRGEELYRLTSESIVRTSPLAAVRGELRDRRGRALATTRPSFDVLVSPPHLDRRSYARLVELLARDRPELPEWQQLQAAGKGARDGGYVLAEDVTEEQMAAIATAMDLDGVSIRVEARRRYPYGALFTHTLGFTNQITAEDLARRRDDGYRLGDRIGRTGLERQWEARLRGRAGFEKTVVDRRNRPLPGVNVAELIGGPAREEPVPGHNVILTLDLDIQRAAEQALRGRPAAAAVVVEVDTGRVLAMVSLPGFDPNLMSGRLTREQQNRLARDPHRPFRDKTVADTYNPGSTFKLVTAAAALEDRVASGQRTFCRGYVEVGKRRFRCTHQHGHVSMEAAIVQSCNIFFYELGARPGMMDRIAARARAFGLGETTGLGINAESAGLVPSEAWHNSRGPGEAFSLGHALNTAIGEGATRVTVLQMALLYAAIANGGHLMAPQLVDRVETADGQLVERVTPRERRRVELGAETLAVLHRGLAGVVNDKHGTAYRARSKMVLMAGKTGTAQTHLSKKIRKGLTSGAGPDLDHAWFAGYAPVDRPRIAFAVLVEHGGFGGEVSAPVARQIVEAALAPPPTAQTQVHVQAQAPAGSGTGAAAVPP